MLIIPKFWINDAFSYFVCILSNWVFKRDLFKFRWELSNSFQLIFHETYSTNLNLNGVIFVITCLHTSETSP